MLNSSLKFLMVATIGLSLGCSEDKDKSGDNGEFTPPSPPVTKPLPDECFSSVDVSFNWGEDATAFKYVLEVGYQAGGTGDTFILDAPKESFTLDMDRGSHYYFTLTQYDNLGSPRAKYFNLEIPRCADRDEFKKKNPTYEEPPQFNFQWNN